MIGDDEGSRRDVGETVGDRREREKDVKDKASDVAKSVAKSTQRRSRADLFVVAALMFAIFATERFIDAKNRTDRLDVIFDGIEQACENDTPYKEEYRDRGKLDKAVAEFLLEISAESVKAGTDTDGNAQDFIDEIGPLEEEIDILPIPDCHKEREELEARLNE